ncbi:FAD/NAD(P)-binding oxidoreductase, partial [Staphylococcus aureus]
MNKHYQIVIIGGGTAGVTVASRLLRKNQNLKEKIAIIDPADHRNNGHLDQAVNIPHGKLLNENIPFNKEDKIYVH